MNFMEIIPFVVMIGLLIIALVPPLLVLRGQRFWGPFLMIGAVILFVLSLGGLIGVQWYLSQEIQKLSASGGSSFYKSSDFQRLTDQMELGGMVFGGLIMVSFVCYAGGFLGVAGRWGRVAKRAKELEAQTAELAERRGAGPGV